jgi:hypothetical protein
MKRLVVIALLLVTTSSASPRRVVHIPTISELCPGGESWDKIGECIKRQAPFKLLRDEENLKLVQIDEPYRFGGLYIYTHPKQWKLHGEVRLYQPHEVLAFDRVTFGKRSGYRIDVGISAASSVSFDGETSVDMLIRQKLTNLCFDNSYCMQVTTACDVFVHGKAYYSFRGKVVYENRQLKIVGDRTNAGQYCAQGELLSVDDQ